MMKRVTEWIHDETTRKLNKSKFWQLLLLTYWSNHRSTFEANSFRARIMLTRHFTDGSLRRTTGISQSFQKIPVNLWSQIHKHCVPCILCTARDEKDGRYNRRRPWGSLGSVALTFRGRRVCNAPDFEQAWFVRFFTSMIEVKYAWAKCRSKQRTPSA